MFRQLTKKDYEMTMKFLGQNPGLNLFQIGDIENYGFDSDIQTVWGTFDERDTLTGVLLRYRENYIPYFIDANQSVSFFKNQILKDETIKIISGKSDLVDQFKSCFEQSEDKEMYFCELVDRECLQPVHVNVQLAQPEDAERVYELLLTIEEFDAMHRHSSERIRQKIEDQSGRIYFVENESGEVICTVQTTAENSKSAMVVSVATHKNYLRQGLMTQALSRLCEELLSEGKTLCLFYDNPEAGSVYHKLGFKTIGKWKMIVRRS